MIRIKKGLDLPISGAPTPTLDDKAVSAVAVLGADYPGLRPALLVRSGDRVMRGQALFTDKKNPGVQVTAPAGGVVKAINRGERRALLSVVIQIDETEPQQEFESFEANELVGLSREQVRDNLVSSGLWTSLRSRPFGKVPAVDATPHGIFVTAMDTNPLAADPATIVSLREQDFVNGLTILSRLTPGKVYLCKAPGSAIPLGRQDTVVVEEFAGPHPAGLAGTHIHFLDPVHRHKSVWTVNYQDVMAMGHLFTTGELCAERIIALGGPQVKTPRLLRTRLGAPVTELLEGELKAGDHRIISGSVLHGRVATGVEAYLGRFHNQISILEEGRQQELLGWITPGRDKYSVFNLFISRLLGKRRFDLNTNTGGSKRAMVPIGTYEAVMPLDILATPLLRALIVGDTDSAQQLGCLELDEEDLALCTFVCPGKYDYGPLLRQALTQIEKEG